MQNNNKKTVNKIDREAVFLAEEIMGDLMTACLAMDAGFTASVEYEDGESWYLGDSSIEGETNVKLSTTLEFEDAQLFADEAIQRARRKLSSMGAPDYVDVCVEVVGDESHWGEAARYVRSREVAVKVACRHADRRATDLLMRELSGVALGAPAGFCSFAGTRPKSSPVIRLFSILVDRDLADIQIHTEDQAQTFDDARAIETDVAKHADGVADDQCASALEAAATASGRAEQIVVPLERLAWARSGDKGDKANIGVMARKREYFPWIAAALTESYVASRFEHFMASPEMDRYELPGLPALNFVLHHALGGGGVASLRNDPQAKGYAQILLDTPVSLPTQLLED